ncbi:hypothetical protein [uncultured Helicobacter sp.]|nr:hypothetical protein [uncultured Helicobacter sp.]
MVIHCPLREYLSFVLARIEKPSQVCKIRLPQPLLYNDESHAVIARSR